MPLTGTLDLAELLAGIPTMERLDANPWELPRAEVMQLMFEIAESGMTSLLPRALHPTIPPTVLFNVMAVPESPVGPFSLAEVRIGCRATTRPRAFLARAYCNSARAIDELRRRWGYPVERGEIDLRRNYDMASAVVEVSGVTVLDIAVGNPEAISGADIQYLPNLNLCRVRRDGIDVVRLVQVDPEYVFHKADRGRPIVHVFDAAAWKLAGAKPSWPISASYVVADISMPEIRYLIDPEKPPLASIERV